MDFLDRREELARLDRLAAAKQGGLAVVYGRRRLGKTRLLLEWCRKHGGLYTVADESSPEVQRRYFADAAAQRITGFGDVGYRDWGTLLARLAREARALDWRGPLVFDELPYLVTASPELPSILQRWIDHEGRDARLVVAVAGSSQRMMQGLVLASNAPLYGRAREVLEVGPLDAVHLAEAFPAANTFELIELYTAWGGVPRYWELAADLEGGPRRQVEQLVLDARGPLHQEPDRLLLEEIPPASEVRPLLDAIGAGAHRVSEIAGRVGRPATSMSRPLERLISMGLVLREVPFGESERRSRKSLYGIDDPFLRLWFRLVAPHRGQLAAANSLARVAFLDHYWGALVAHAWEELCRKRLARLGEATAIGREGPWKPAARWWSGAEVEWDLVSESVSGKRILLGEAHWSPRPMTARAVERLLRDLLSKPPPILARFADHEPVRALFVPEIDVPDAFRFAGVTIVTAKDVLRAGA